MIIYLSKIETCCRNTNLKPPYWRELIEVKIKNLEEVKEIFLFSFNLP